MGTISRRMHIPQAVDMVLQSSNLLPPRVDRPCNPTSLEERTAISRLQPPAIQQVGHSESSLYLQHVLNALS